MPRVIFAHTPRFTHTTQQQKWPPSSPPTSPSPPPPRWPRARSPPAAPRFPVRASGDHRLGETNNFIRASRTRRGRAETTETRGALDVSGFASDSRTWTDRRFPNPRSTTVKRSVSVKAVRKQQVVARCVRQIENPSPCDFRRAIARVDARSERGRAGTRARDHDRLEPLLALAHADSEASDRARAAAAAATQRHASEVSPDRSTVRG